MVVLAHALGTTLMLWQPQLPALASRYRVLRYDQRGHGRSDAPPGPYSVEELGGDLLRLLDRLGIERASLCGISLGGAVAMWVAAEAPERVESLALCCTSARFPAPESWLERAQLARRQGMGAVVELAFARWFRPHFAAEHALIAQRFRRMLAESPPEGYAAACEAIAAWDFESELSRIATPTLVLSAAEDVSTPPEHGARLARGIRGARLEMVSDAGHLVNVEQPGAFDEALLEHLSVALAMREAP